MYGAIDRYSTTTGTIYLLLKVYTKFSECIGDGFIVYAVQ